MRRFYLSLTSCLIAITVTVASAPAQDMMQGEPQISPAPRPTHAPRQPSNPEMQIPQQVQQQPWTPPPTPAPAPAPAPPPPPPPPISIPMMAPQPVLPPVFRGCWQGTVESVDSMERAPGGRKLGYWTPKTYRLCYKRVGDGPYQLTFGETGVVASEKIKYSRGRVEIITTDGRSFARMRAFLHFDEYRAGVNFGGSTFAVDEVTMLECQIDGDQMRVSAEVDGRREDEPWFSAHWHTTFTRVPM
jgi:hypothetical protein